MRPVLRIGLDNGGKASYDGLPGAGNGRDVSSLKDSSLGRGFGPRLGPPSREAYGAGAVDRARASGYDPASRPRGAREGSLSGCPRAASGGGRAGCDARSGLTGAASGSRMAVRAAEAGARLSVL